KARKRPYSGRRAAGDRHAPLRTRQHAANFQPPRGRRWKTGGKCLATAPRSLSCSTACSTTAISSNGDSEVGRRKPTCLTRSSCPYQCQLQRRPCRSQPEVIFPTEGCWEVTGEVGETSLTFVTRSKGRYLVVRRPLIDSFWRKVGC